MASQYDPTDFIDHDYQNARSAYGSTAAQSNPFPGMASFNQPPSRDELDLKVGEAQQRLEELRREQEKLQRERAALEDARRRQNEFQVGREEMLQHLTRGVGLLEEAELNARREAEQQARSLADLREHLNQVKAIQESAWTQENWTQELTRALVVLENARNEWNSARLKWPVLNAPPAGPEPKETAVDKLVAGKTFGDLCRIGFALNWPVAVLGLIVLLIVLLKK